MASPAPLTDTSSRGVRTRTCRPPSDASRSTQSPGVSSVTSDVVSTTRGPSACTAATASFTASSEVVVVPERRSSSKWLGVTMSAAGTATSRRNSSMPGRTNTPRPTSPITGSQQ